MNRLAMPLLILLQFGFSASAAGYPGIKSVEAESDASASSYGDTLFGDWNGKREAMFARGYDLRIVYKLDLIGKASPPNRNLYGLDNLDIKLSMDGEKIAGLDGSSALLYILSNQGSKPAVHGDRLTHGVDNIETPYNANTTKIYQAWVQQSFIEDRFQLLVGLYDLNSEFYVTESSGIFILPTFGIGAEMGGTGQNGPSIFPTASFAIRAKAMTDTGYYLQAATLDGVPGDPNNPQGTHVQFNKGDGALNIIEGGIPLGSAENASKLAAGVWRYTARFDDLLDPSVKRISRGYYAVVEKVLGYKTGSNQESISSFVRAGKNDGDTTQSDMSWSAGLVFSGLIAGRDQDQLGIAFAQMRNGAKYRAVPGNSAVANENSLELAYLYHVMPGVELQPEVQYMINHASDPAQDKSWWLGIRSRVSF